MRLGDIEVTLLQDGRVDFKSHTSTFYGQVRLSKSQLEDLSVALDWATENIDYHGRPYEVGEEVWYNCYGLTASGKIVEIGDDYITIQELRELPGYRLKTIKGCHRDTDIWRKQPTWPR